MLLESSFRCGALLALVLALVLVVLYRRVKGSDGFLSDLLLLDAHHRLHFGITVLTF